MRGFQFFSPRLINLFHLEQMNGSSKHLILEESELLSSKISGVPSSLPVHCLLTMAKDQ